VETLRYSSNEHIVRVLDLIRNKKASLDEIKAYLEGQVPDSEIEMTPELQEAHDQLEERAQKRSSRRMLDVMWLSHIPVVEVPAAPWTTVTNDDSLVSYLISLWLTWSHPFCNWIDRDLFIRDMKSSDTNSKFCSPFLVNSILAEASVSP
jgi:DNA-binding transcriptional MerR regulator